MRRYGEPVVRGQAYRDRPGAYGVIVEGDAMLLVGELNPKIGHLDVQMPGGGIDAGESPTQALHREVMEETGYRIAIERRIAQYQRYCYMPDYDMWARKIANIFLCRPISRTGTPDPLTQDVYWVPLDQAAEFITNPADSQFLAETHPIEFAFNRKVRG